MKPCPTGQYPPKGTNPASNLNSPARPPNQPVPYRLKSPSLPSAHPPRSPSSQDKSKLIGDWSEWSECTCKTKEKRRHRKCFAEDELQCSRMTITFEGVPCVPDKDCTAYEKERERKKLQQQEMRQVRQQMEQEKSMSAFGPWEEWSTCSCSKNTKYHVRKCVVMDQRRCSEGKGSYESVPCQPTGCPIPSTFTPWGPWNKCSCASREQVRTRHCTSIEAGCAGPTSERRTCQPTDCGADHSAGSGAGVAMKSGTSPVTGPSFTPWSTWSPCQCSTKQKSRKRICTSKITANCPNGQKSESERTFCIPHNCKGPSPLPSVTGPSFTPWSTWSLCQCRTKQKFRERICTAKITANCPNGQKSEVESTFCIPHNCKVPSPLLSGNQLGESRQPEPGQFSAWGTWSQCSCKTWEISRQRVCLSKHVNACPASGIQTEEKPCSPEGCQDTVAAAGNRLAHKDIPLEIPSREMSRSAPPLLEEVAVHVPSSATLTCDIDWMHENPYGDVQWFQNGRLLRNLNVKGNPSRLHFDSVSQYEEGVYACGVTFNSKTDIHCVILLHVLTPTNTTVHLHDPRNMLELYYPLLLPAMLFVLFGGAVLLQCRRCKRKLAEAESGGRAIRKAKKREKKRLKEEKKNERKAAKKGSDYVDSEIGKRQSVYKDSSHFKTELSGKSEPGPSLSEPSAPGPPSSGSPPPRPPSPPLSGPPVPGPPSSQQAPPGSSSPGPPGPGPPSGPLPPGPPSSGPPAPGPPSSEPPPPGPSSSGPPAPGPPSPGLPPPGPPSSGPPPPGPPSSQKAPPGPSSSGPPGPGPPSGPPPPGPPAPGPPSSGPPPPGPPSSGSSAAGPPSSGPPAPGPTSSGPPPPPPP
ncbi:MAGE-like protein 2 [Holothuria leucospilota]|uniref:MAGE-like protein 2 n=1 Tax=Holothuria leucospilota TaxID=206669 RepID=A0A9Q0YF97_HOLLE|nr:MAGE-like protein 2 [Holothuria leucospilota]